MIEPITTAVQEITIDSNRILHHTEADLIDRRIPNVVRVVQYDKTLPVIAVDLKKGGVTYALPSGAACNIRIKKPDGYIVYNPALGCDSTRTTVYFEVTSQMVVETGELQTIIEVIVAENVAGTSAIRIVVERNPIQEDDIESTAEMKTLTELIYSAEAWARGTINGVPVPSDADQYNNNSLYYSQQSELSAEASAGSADTAEGWSDISRNNAIDSEAWAVGKRGGIDVGSTDITYHNNSKYYAGIMDEAYRQALSAVQVARAYINLMRDLIGTIHILTEDGSYLTTENGDRLIADY